MKLATRSLFAVLALAASASFAIAAPSNWKIDAAHTEVGFEVRHFFSKVHGVFHDVEGTIAFDEADPAAIKIDATVKVASVDTGNEKRDGHLQSADFFEAEKNPTLTFKSTKVAKAGKGKFKITGDLTMRGVTKSVVFDADFLGASDISVGGQSWGSKAGFAATTTVNRKDFGINWNKTLDNGGVMVDDMVKIVLNIEADKAQAQ
ncbi:MAG: YceI family protein [Candidatus Eisenbacteria bacterium]